MHGLRLSSFGLRGFAGKSLTPEVVIDFAAAFGTFLVLAPDYDRMRDPGRHVFEHRVVPYAGRWQDAGIVELAEAFHTPLPLARLDVAVRRVPSSCSPRHLRLVTLRRTRKGET
jgi:hypothetical protein